jgi:hypothetical protein
VRSLICYDSSRPLAIACRTRMVNPMWTILKMASGVTAIAIGFIFFRWLEWLPRKNSEWGPLTFPTMCIAWVVVFGIGVVGFLAPDFIARNLYKLEQPVQLRFSLRSLLIVTTFLAVVLGMIVWLDRAWIAK